MFMKGSVYCSTKSWGINCPNVKINITVGIPVWRNAKVNPVGIPKYVSGRFGSKVTWEIMYT